MKFQKLKIALASSILVVAPEILANQIEEIIVSATKRAESIQDVPVSVGAVSGEQIKDLGLVDMADLSVYVPNFQLNSAAVAPNLYIRGLGGGLTHSIEQSVGRYVDGVYIGRAVMSTHGFMDIAGVEVLRGPQGTLFGKNTLAGALILRTAEPTDTHEAGIDLSAGSYSTTGGNKEMQAYISGPLTDDLTGRIAVRYRDKEGFYLNQLEGPDGEQRTDEAMRVKLKWSPTDQFTANLKLEYAQYDYLGSDAAEMPNTGDKPLSKFVAYEPSFTTGYDYKIFVDCTDTFTDDGTSTGAYCPGRDQDYTNATLQLDYDVDAGTFTSITAFQEYNYEYRFNGLDGGLAMAFKARRDEEYSGFSQEFRFTSTEGEVYDYIAGLYFEDSDLYRNQMSEFNLKPLLGGGPPLMGRAEPWTQDTQSWAAFAQVRWNLNDKLTMIIGGRYADEDKDFVFDRFFRDYGVDAKNPNMTMGPGGPAISVSDSRSEGKFTGGITAQWHANDDAMFYASFTQGHKTGGFSDRIDNANANFEFYAETNDTFELGAKTTWLDGALAVNATLYHMSIEGLQDAARMMDNFNLPVFSVINAADTTSQGLEADFIWNVNDVFTLGGNYALTDATYDSYPGSESCPTGVTPAADGTCDLAGFTLPYAPENKGTLYGDLFMEDAIGEWDVNLHADVNYTSDNYSSTQYFDSEIIVSHTTFNASIRFVSPSEKYSLSLLGKNLTDEIYCLWCLEGGPAALAPPQEISVRFSARLD